MKRIIYILIILIITYINAYSQTDFTSIKTGDWSDPTTWDQNSVPTASDNIIISSGNTVTVDINNANIVDVTIESKGVLNIASKGLLIYGNIDIDGTFTGNKNLELIGGAGITVDGTGSIKTNFNFQGDATILSTANLHIINSIKIDNNVSVSNYGQITITEDLKGSNSGSTWTNETNSTLQISDELFPTSGVLYASATGNTVIYNSDINFQNIETPFNNTYYNIEFSGIKEKKAADNLIFKGNVFIVGGTFQSNNKTFNVRGNWSSFSIFDVGTSTVIFDGTNDQTISRPGGETFYNFQINKSSGTLYLDEQITVSNELTMTAGNIDANDNYLELGTSTANIGTLTYTAGTVIGKFRRWIVASATPYNFPVGTSSYNRPVDITFPIIQFEGTITFQFVESNPQNSGLPISDAGTTVYNTFVDGYWDMTNENGFNLGNNKTYDIDLYGTGFIGFSINSSTRILTRTNIGSNWQALGNQGTNSSPMVQRTGEDLTTSQFCFADTSNCSAPVTSAITGSTDVCTGTLAEPYSVTDNGNTYYWSIDGGTQSPVTNNASITVDWGSVGTVGNITVQEYNGCTYSYPVSLDVNVHSIQPSSISGKVNVPQNTLGEGYSVTGLTGYTYTWSVTGGNIASGQNTSNITIDWGTAGQGVVSVIAEYSGCTAAPNTDLDVNIYYVINSKKTGDWDDTATWDCSCIPDVTDNVRIVTTHTVSLVANTEVNHFTVDAGATLDMLAKTFELNGDLTNDGIITGSNTIKLSGTGVIDGTGTFSARDLLIYSNRQILSSALLLVETGDINLDNNGIYMVTNYGNITVLNDIVGKTSTEKYWTNKENSTLNIGGILLANGRLIADATDNTVNYIGSTDQTIKDPAATSNGYWNLILSGAGIKTPTNDLTINGELVIKDNAQLDVASGNFDISIAGDWIDTSYNADPFLQGNTTETVTFNSSGSQYIICPNTEIFNNLIIEYPSETILNAGSSITAAGITTLNGTFRLKSPANAYEPSASFIDNGTINMGLNGKMIAERYINGSQWHEISAPIISADVTTAIFTRSHPSGNFNPNLYIYDETMDLDNDPLTAPADPFDNSYLAYAWTYAHNGNLGADVNLSENTGYMFYTTVDQLFEFEGTPATGTFNASGLSYTDNDPFTDGVTENVYDGWHLLGNPYPSYLDWDLIRASGLTNVDDGVYVWDNNQYAGYQNGISVMSGNLGRYIPPMQGFFVRTNATNATVAINNTYRAHATSQEYLKKKSPSAPKSILKIKTSNDNYNDYIAIYFEKDATTEFDGKYDLLRMFGNNPNIPEMYFFTDKKNNPLALSCVPSELMSNYSARLGYKIGKAGNYNISVDELDNIDNVQIYLEDTYENKIVNLRTQPSYNFYFEGGKVDDRFIIHFNKNTSPVCVEQIKDRKTLEDEYFSLKIDKTIFKDYDNGDTIRLSAKLANGSNLPEWLHFANNTLYGTPENNNVGSYEVQIIATDILGATAKTTFILEVENVNDAPFVANPIPDQIIGQGQMFYFQIPENVFKDIDLNDKIEISIRELPEWLTFSSSDNLLIGTPTETGTIEIIVRGTDLEGEFAQNIFDIKVMNSTGIDYSTNDNVEVFPNPSSDFFNVNLTNSYSGILNIYSLDGKLVISKHLSKGTTTIDIKNLPIAIYNIEIITDDAIVKKKLIKN